MEMVLQERVLWGRGVLEYSGCAPGPSPTPHSPLYYYTINFLSAS